MMAAGVAALVAICASALVIAAASYACAARRNADAAYVRARLGPEQLRDLELGVVTDRVVAAIARATLEDGTCARGRFAGYAAHAGRATGKEVWTASPS